MPLYEYKCKSCGKVFEVMQKFSDEPLALHEACGGAVERLISPPAFQFKGSGWYVTDYARGNGKGGGKHGGEESAKRESAPKTESKAETKPDSKPAAPASQ